VRATRSRIVARGLVAIAGMRFSIQLLREPAAPGSSEREERVNRGASVCHRQGMDTDVVVIGGGSAGLQAALTLGRMRFEVTVIDAGAPSNAPAHAIGGLLGAHAVPPLDLLATGRRQLAELPSVRVIDGEATRVDEDHTVTLAGGSTLAARAVVLATGAPYQVPDVPGIADLWGTSVIHCPFCHGWEARDSRIGLLVASEDHAGHLVPLLRRLSAHLEVFDAIAEVRAQDGALRAAVMPDGTEVACDVLFVAAPPKPRDTAFAHLPLERIEAGLVAVDAFGRTSSAGVYAAGDLVAEAPAVVQALATGQRAAIGVTRDLTADDPAIRPGRRTAAAGSR
jgi:thioredoxin reductase